MFPDPAALGIKLPPPPTDPMERYGKLLTLRELMAHGRRGELEEQRLRFTMQEAQRKREEEERFRGALGRGATFGELVRISPPLAYAYRTSEQGAVKAEREAKTADVALQEKKAQYDQLRKGIVVQKMHATLKDPDPANREKRYLEIAPELLELGLITPDDAALPFDENLVERLYEQVEPGKYAKMVSERAAEGETRKKAEAEERERKRKFAGFYTGTVTDQESLDRFRQLLGPEDQQVLPKRFDAKTTPAQIQSMFLTPAERETARRAEELARRQAIPNTRTELEYKATDPDATPQERAHAKAGLKLGVKAISGGAPGT